MAHLAVRSAIRIDDGHLGGLRDQLGLDVGRYGHAVTLFNGRIYVVGGLTTTSRGDVPLGDVQYATIESGGELGAWQTGPSLPAPRAFHTLEAL